MCKDIFISVAEEFEDRQRIKAGEATCIRDEMRILSAMHDVLREFEAMYWQTYARAHSYGSPRFSSEAEMRAYYDAPMPIEKHVVLTEDERRIRDFFAFAHKS